MALPLLSRFGPAAFVTAAACASNHVVSPFLPPDEVRALLRPAHDLDGNVARARKGLAQAGLRESFRLDGQTGGEPFVALAAEGHDAFDADVHAVRVVTASGVVLALGPPDARQPDRSEPCELVRSLDAEGRFASGRDLTGDGAPDLGVRAPDGTLALYRVKPLGAARYPVSLAARPTRAADVDGDGRVDLLGAIETGPSDALVPSLVDVAFGVGDRFDHDAVAATAYHRRRAGEESPSSADGVARLRGVIERAFHAVRAGDSPFDALAAEATNVARAGRVGDEVASAFVRWRAWLVAHDDLRPHDESRGKAPAGSRP